MKVYVDCSELFQSSGWVCPRCGGSPQRVDGHYSFAPQLAQHNDGFSPDYFDRLIEQEQGSFWWASRNLLIIWALGTFFPAAQSFLEVGCGTAFVLAAIGRQFPGLTIAGTEIFSHALTYARHRAERAALFQADATDLPFSGEYDVIGAFDALEHIEDDRAVLEAFYRAATPDGGIILTVPQHQWLWSYGDEFAHHKRRYSAAKLKRQVQDAGFEVQFVTSFVTFLLPLMMASRVRQRKVSPSSYDPTAETALPAALNAAFGALLAAERRLISGGMSLPVGGSLLLIARKKKSSR